MRYWWQSVGEVAYAYCVIKRRIPPPVDVLGELFVVLCVVESSAELSDKRPFYIRIDGSTAH